MLLGHCCHCVSGVVCTICDGGIAPALYKVTVATSAGDALSCCSAYNGDFYPPYIGGCAWQSTELAYSIKDDSSACIGVISAPMYNLFWSYDYGTSTAFLTFEMGWYGESLIPSRNTTTWRHIFPPGSLADCFLTGGGGSQVLTYLGNTGSVYPGPCGTLDSFNSTVTVYVA